MYWNRRIRLSTAAIVVVRILFNSLQFINQFTLPHCTIGATTASANNPYIYMLMSYMVYVVYIYPHETSIIKFQKRFSVNVWCGVLGSRLIGPFVFHNNLTGKTYEAFLRNELPCLLEDIPLMIRSQMYFQHDGAPPHYTQHVRHYPNHWLGRGGLVAWPPRSPDFSLYIINSGATWRH
jgi:hypothetical protein